MLGFTLTEEQQAYQKTARTFARNVIAPAASTLDEESRFPKEILEEAWRLGLMNCTLPEELGGCGLSALIQCLILEQVSWACAGVTTSLASNSLASFPLLIAGTQEQKERYLGWLIREPIFAAFCCSEPEAGSDVAAIRTSYQKDGNEYVLSGQKRWITNGSVSSFYAVLATSATPAEQKEPGSRHRKLSFFLVERDRNGVSVGRKENKLGQRASDTSDVIFDEVRVPASALIGREGDGFSIAMQSFDRARPWTPASASGLIGRAIHECRSYALERRTFGVPIAQHQAIQMMLADMVVAYENSRLLYQKAAWMLDEGLFDSMSSSIAKLYSADAAMKVAIDAVQVLGGYGYTKDYVVEKLMRDAKLLQIYEGTSQIQRVVIAKNLFKQDMF